MLLTTRVVHGQKNRPVLHARQEKYTVSTLHMLHPLCTNRPIDDHFAGEPGRDECSAGPKCCAVLVK